jgi:hypothetical protein
VFRDGFWCIGFVGYALCVEPGRRKEVWEQSVVCRWNEGMNETMLNFLLVCCIDDRINLPAFSFVRRYSCNYCLFSSTTEECVSESIDPSTSNRNSIYRSSPFLSFPFSIFRPNDNIQQEPMEQTIPFIHPFIRSFFLLTGAMAATRSNVLMERRMVQS